MTGTDRKVEQAGTTNVIVYFYSPGCPDCKEVRDSVLPMIVEQGVGVDAFDVATSEGISKILEVERSRAISLTLLAPVVVAGRRVFEGLENIQSLVIDVDRLPELVNDI